MNRLILIGNGFDLAHGLKISYNHFMEDFWQQIDLNYLNPSRSKEENQNFIKDFISKTDPSIEIPSIQSLNLLKRFIQSKSHFIHYKNKFLTILADKSNNKNWVDIELVYYNTLTKLLNQNYHYRRNIPISIGQLNEGLEFIKNELEKYLIRESEKIKPEIRKQEFQTVMNEFPHEKDFSNRFLKKIENESYDFYNEWPKNLLLLNFNYTSTAKLYARQLDVPHIQIHGELNNPDNPIIFGYGDELDENYKDIENKNENEYLENIKSIRYLQTDNYKKMLRFINADYFQVYIFGHSCGNSDRTLLNTIFEHENCVSIKPFYRIKEDGTDNYTDIIMNISRNFTDKASFRDKVVDKRSEMRIFG